MVSFRITVHPRIASSSFPKVKMKAQVYVTIYKIILVNYFNSSRFPFSLLYMIIYS